MTDLTLLRRYNSLCEDDEQRLVNDDHLIFLGRLFVRYNVHEVFGIHLTHGHFKIPPETVMLGTMFKRQPTGHWTQPEPLDTLLNLPIHGYIFAFTPTHNLLAYEYRTGEPPEAVKNLNAAFLNELSAFLLANRLNDLLGLEVLSQSTAFDPHLEFEVAGQATVVVRADHAIHNEIYRITSWTFNAETDGILSVKGNTSHASYKGIHKIFTDGKLGNIDAGVDFLLQKGVFKLS
ncbi:MAG: hypothetical protein Q9167_008094 [Letrouitia subvulpina]